MPHPRIPSYRLHKSTGQAVVTLRGRDFYLGPHGSPGSREKYNRLVAEYLANGAVVEPAAAASLTVSGLVDAYLCHYDTLGRVPSQVERVVRSLGHARALYGPTPAARFGPLALRAVRQRMVDAGYCRRHANQCVGCVKTCWAWGASMELVPPAVLAGLRAIRGLERGEGGARESEPVRPVPGADLAAVLPLVLPPVRALLELQLWTGARPGEVLGLTPGHVARGGEVELLPGVRLALGAVWAAVLAEHKTARHGHGPRVLLFGPRAQAVLAPWLFRDAGAFCFSPREAVEALRRQGGRRLTFGRSRTPGGRYTVSSYGHAVARACEKAGVTPWHPHQLRHSSGSRLASEFGPEVARIVLGHRSLAVTRVYVEDDLRKAVDAIGRVG